MQFELDEDRALLKQSVRELLANEAPLEASRAVMEAGTEGYAKSLYAKLAELGYLGLAVPEKDGGSGIGSIGLAAVLHEMGRVALPGPYLDLVEALEALRLAGGEARGWLRRALAGEALVVLARRESPADAEAGRPSASFQGGRVRGIKTFVPFGAQADALLVTTREGLVLTARPDSGWQSTALQTLDHAQRFARLELDGPASLVADPPATEALLACVDRLGALGASALLLGLMEQALETTVAYTTERQAFSAPIASFQALQHRLADMLIQTERTRAAVYRAAWACECAPDQAPLLVPVAKACAADAARFVCGEAIQLHGGVGFTWEYDPHIYYKRTKTLEQFHGATRTQLEAVLQASDIP